MDHQTVGVATQAIDWGQQFGISISADKMNAELNALAQADAARRAETSGAFLARILAEVVGKRGEQATYSEKGATSSLIQVRPDDLLRLCQMAAKGL
jgi:hypothetical protein